MVLAMEIPENIIHIRIRDLLIDETCTWEGVSITRTTQGQYQVVGYGQVKKVGSGRTSVAKVLTLVVAAVLQLHAERAAYPLQPAPGPVAKRSRATRSRAAKSSIQRTTDGLRQLALWAG